MAADAPSIFIFQSERVAEIGHGWKEVETFLGVSYFIQTINALSYIETKDVDK